MALPPAPCDACEKVSTRATSISMVRHRGNDCSVPVACAHHEVQVRGYVGEVVIGAGTEVIARHRRSCEKADMVFDPLHVLPLLERKVGAPDQAAPLQGWDLPGEFATLRRLLEAGLKPVDGIGPFPAARDLVRRVGADCGLRGRGGRQRLRGALAADRRAGAGDRLRRRGADPAWRAGGCGARGRSRPACPGRRPCALRRRRRRRCAGRAAVADVPVAPPSPELLRPPAGYDAAAGGAW